MLFVEKIVSATISRIADRWFVSIQVQLAEKPAQCESQASVGVDLGFNLDIDKPSTTKQNNAQIRRENQKIAWLHSATMRPAQFFNFPLSLNVILSLATIVYQYPGFKAQATLFDGDQATTLTGAKPLDKWLKKLKKEQRRLSKKQKGSRNYTKQRMKAARLHYRIRCIRQDGLHKLTTYLTRQYRVISIEDLHVKGMMSNHCLARHVADQGFYEFRRQLTYKSELRGNQLVVADRWFPSSKRCSVCHVVKDNLSLSDREFVCEACGMRCDRDENAAMNLYTQALGINTVSYAGFEACGEVSSGMVSNWIQCETSLSEAGTKHEQICSDFR